MKIIVPALGSRGDVQPYIALCQGLRRAGHQAILASCPTMRDLVCSYGVDFAPVGPDIDLGLEIARLWAKGGRNWAFGMIRVMSFGSKLVEQAYPDILELCREADLVVASDAGAGSAEADRLGLPWVSVTLQPARLPVPDPTPSFIKRTITRLTWGVLGAAMMAPLNRFRRRVGAPPVKGLSGTGNFSSRLILIPVSPSVVSPDPRWPATAHLTGYWYAQPQQSWQPPDDLLAFLDAGETPVAISLGAMSMTGNEAAAAARITLEAIQQAGVRAVVQGWDEPLAGIALPQGVFHAGSLPHSWLFACVSAVVHHGGFGTTSSGLYAGVPAVVVPHMMDQFYWGQHVAELGAGPAPIPRLKLTAEALARAMRQAVDDGKMRAHAARIGEQIRSEPDSLANATGLIEAAAV